MGLKLADYPTRISDWDRKAHKEKTKEILKKIGSLQYKMQAQGKSSLLIVFQGMDASGKDGLIRKLFKYAMPVSISIISFKKPTPIEYAHDFLWRVHKHSPQKGHTQVFIRSHYEDILVPSVEGFLPSDLIEERYELINQFEKLLEHNGTRVLKFFLNVSMEEQKERLMERVNIREKHWKHNDGDWETRKKFNEYMDIYENIFNRCNVIPWHIIPADSNSQKLFKVSEIVLKELEKMDLQWPALETDISWK